MPADIAQARGAQQRVAQGMNQHVAVGMRDDLVGAGDFHAAQHHAFAGFEAMDIETLADANHVPFSCRASQNSASARSSGLVTLMLLSRPGISRGR